MIVNPVSMRMESARIKDLLTKTSETGIICCTENRKENETGAEWREERL